MITPNEMIQVSFIGIGLIIAVYALIQPSLTELIKKREDKLKKETQILEELIKKLEGDKKNEDLLEKIRKSQGKVNRLGRSPYHYDLGYISSGVLFSVVLIINFLAYNLEYNPEGLFNLDSFIIYSPYLLFIGILNFLAVWILTMIDFRNLTLAKYEEVQEKSKEKEDESIKILKRIDEKLEESEKRERNKEFRENFGFSRILTKS
jgi:uncharacterized membrane protein